METDLTHIKGVAISFFTQDDAPLAKDLVSIMEKSGQEPPQELLSMRNSGGGRQKQKYRAKGERMISDGYGAGK